jgi:hypothetical protein
MKQMGAPASTTSCALASDCGTVSREQMRVWRIGRDYDPYSMRVPLMRRAQPAVHRALYIEETVMTKYLCYHTFGPGQITCEQAKEISEASQKDPTVKGERSFLNLSEGKAVCIWEAPNEQALARWFDKMKVPYEAILPVELEGYRGKLTELIPSKVHATV